jgi:hypothetical protein
LNANNIGGPGGAGLSNAIDKENKILATRLKKCPNFRVYKQVSQSLYSSR